jgi:hypothetical protein
MDIKNVVEHEAEIATRPLTPEYGLVRMRTRESGYEVAVDLTNTTAGVSFLLEYADGCLVVYLSRLHHGQIPWMNMDGDDFVGLNIILQWKGLAPIGVLAVSSGDSDERFRTAILETFVEAVEALRLHADRILRGDFSEIPSIHQWEREQRGTGQ